MTNGKTVRLIKDHEIVTIVGAGRIETFKMGGLVKVWFAGSRFLVPDSIHVGVKQILVGRS